MSEWDRWMSRRPLRAVAAVTVAVALVAAGVGSAAISGPSTARLPRCFGAAARDPEHPCRNPRLERSVEPSLSNAAIRPDLPCATVEIDGQGQVIDGLMRVCAFGSPLASAPATVALVGDSHAMTARAMVDIVARSKRWRAVAMERAGCPLSATILPLPTRARDRAGCRRWRRRVFAWLGRHPEVSVLFVAEFAGPRRSAGYGRAALKADEAGYRRAWKALPATISHIVVIRDNPRFTTGTFDCIRRALARRARPGRACARARAVALPPDPAALAAGHLRSRRVQVADLTPFMCDGRLCYPVVGGVLVVHDTTHMTRLFATTLGPYLLRRVDRLSRSWLRG
jgi:hypothetical protein